MLLIQSAADLLNLRLPDAHLQLLQHRWRHLAGVPPYDPEAEGYLVYLQSEDIDQPLTAIGLHMPLSQLGFDGICFYPDAQCYELIRIVNNSFGWTFIVPYSETFNPECLPWLAALLAEGG